MALFLGTKYFFDLSNFAKQNVVITIVGSLIYFGSLITAMIGCHRVFILDRELVLKTSAIRWSLRETKFLGWWLLIIVCSGLASWSLLIFYSEQIEVLLNNPYTKPLIALPLYYFIARFSLVLPATAIDQRNKSMLWSWDVSAGNGMRLALLVGLLPFLTHILLNSLPVYDSIVYSFSVGIFSILIGIVEIGLLSQCYLEFSENEANDHTF